MLRGAAVLAALGALAAPATAGAAVKAPVIKSVTPKHLNVGDKLIIRGKYFRLGKGKNRVLFQRTGGKSLFVKADVSTKVRMTVVVPKALELYMPSSAGALVPSRFRLRVLTSKLSMGDGRVVRLHSCMVHYLNDQNQVYRVEAYYDPHQLERDSWYREHMKMYEGIDSGQNPYRP